MPVFIDEVLAEVDTPAAHDASASPPAQQMPLSPETFDLADTLALIAEREARLRVD
ncbi:hypothetical protein [Halomonas sp. BM-2019]|uniref:hypothetical protein n=1 Tax=Halomonas sp. BM-2019 TaxID=2811227 RepID=UPI001B3C3AE1|nr:MAG: hypothetical protein J5F18_09805 [Halomonas sp. BM-2019]